MDYNYQQIFNYLTSQIDNTCILRLPDNATIPNDIENTDWQAYQVWLAAGNTPLASDA
jgi:hypothetical protein